MIRNLIFDLDGTVLDTITDITIAMNLALEETGYPYRYDREGTKALIGDGADECIRRALKEKGSDLREFNRLKPAYMRLYREHQTEHAVPFPGLKETLIELKKKGFRFSCVTNKPDALAKVVLELNYGEGFFDCIIGQSDAYPRKPDPATVYACMERCDYEKDESAYVGDSHVDIATGHNAGLPVVLCKWGYETDYASCEGDADCVVAKPRDLLMDQKVISLFTRES